MIMIFIIIIINLKKMIEMDELAYNKVGNTKQILYKEIKRLKLLYFTTFIFLGIILIFIYSNLKSKINNNVRTIKALEMNNIKLISEINQLKKLKDSNISIENKIKDIYDKLNVYTPYLDKVKGDAHKKKRSFNETSSIINKDIPKQNIIFEWIQDKIKKSSIEFELIFKMSINGNSAYDFHEHCDDVGPTLILIKTTKDKIFGGFTPLNWKEENEKGIKYDDSNETFIFSLNLMKKYDMIDFKNKEAIKCWNKMGPIFSNDFGLFENLKKGESYADVYSNFLYKNKLELTGGKGKSKKFETKEMEVYRVIY